MTTSEDLLVAKLKKWSYDELLAAVIATFNAADCTYASFSNVFAKAGWTREEYAIEHRRRLCAEFPKLRRKKIK